MTKKSTTESPPTQGGNPTPAPLPLDQRLKTAQSVDVPGLLEEIAALEDDVMRAIHLVTFAGALDVNKKILTTRIEQIRAAHSSGDTTTTMSASPPSVVDLGVDDEGNMTYIRARNDNPLIAGPYLSVVPTITIGETTFVPPTRQMVDFIPVRTGEVERHFNYGHDAKLAEDLWYYLGRFSHITNEQKIILVCFIFLTYIRDLDAISYIPIIYLYAPPSRGKSRTSKAILYVCFRGFLLEQVREPVIFRLIQYWKGTLLYDVRNIWKQALKRDAVDILLWSYEKGATIHRVLFPEKGAFKDMVNFEVFVATIICTNEPIHHVLGTRCLPIDMINKPGQYEDPKPALGLELRERLSAWRARALYQSLPQVNPVEGIVGRLADISKPLFQICMMECPAALDLLKKAILDIAAGQVADKRYSQEFAILTALRDLAPAGQTAWKTTMADLNEAINTDKPEAQQVFPGVVGKKIRELGIEAKIIRGYSIINMTREQLDTLMAQFGVDPDGSKVAENAGQTGDYSQLVDDILNGMDPVKE